MLKQGKAPCRAQRVPGLSPGLSPIPHPRDPDVFFQAVQPLPAVFPRLSRSYGNDALCARSEALKLAAALKSQQLEALQEENVRLAEELGRSRDEVSSHHHKVERPQREGGGSAGAPGLPPGSLCAGKVLGTFGNKFRSHLHGEVGSAG